MGIFGINTLIYRISTVCKFTVRNSEEKNVLASYICCAYNNDSFCFTAQVYATSMRDGTNII